MGSWASWERAVGAGLQGFQRGKRMICGIGGFDHRLENRIRLARVRIDPQEQRIGRQPAQIDDTIYDRLRRVRNFGVAFGCLVDEVCQFRNLFGRRENQVDRFVDIVLDRIERDHTGLPDPRPDPALDMDAAGAFQA